MSNERSQYGTENAEPLSMSKGDSSLFLGQRQTLLGRVCAENITPYPPGIPVVLRGQIIAKSDLEALFKVKNDLNDIYATGRFVVSSDPSLDTILVYEKEKGEGEE